MHEHYIDSVGCPKIAFDAVADPNLYPVMQEIAEEMAESASSRRPYDDVREVSGDEDLIARITNPPESDCGRVMFYDTEAMWSLADRLGHREALDQYFPGDEFLPELD